MQSQQALLNDIASAKKLECYDVEPISKNEAVVEVEKGEGLPLLGVVKKELIPCGWCSFFKCGTYFNVKNYKEKRNHNIILKNNMTIVRIWRKKFNDRKGYFGHISLEIPSKNIYVSFCPNLATEEIKGRLINSFHEDRHMMGERAPDDCIFLYGLNVDLIEFFYLEIQKNNNINHRNISYLSLLTHALINDALIGANDQLDHNMTTVQLANEANCVEVVQFLLKIGGIERFSKSCFPLSRKSMGVLLSFFIASSLAVTLLGKEEIKTLSQKIEIGAAGIIFLATSIIIFISCFFCVINCARGSVGIARPEAIFDTIVSNAAKAEYYLLDNELLEIIKNNKEFFNEFKNRNIESQIAKVEAW